MPLIRDYIAEHERALNFGGDAVRAIDRGDMDRARSLLDELATELTSHWKGEETGIFAVMASEEELYAEHITPLIREHRELDELLATVDITNADGQEAIRKAVFDLHEHISKEEDGIFPASLTALSGDEWDTAIEAWHAAHPGKHMIGR
jgi:iron-sulfur cluster repair protein YtfE (RIC family)